MMLGRFLPVSVPIVRESLIYEDLSWSLNTGIDMCKEGRNLKFMWVQRRKISFCIKWENTIYIEGRRTTTLAVWIEVSSKGARESEERWVKVTQWEALNNKLSFLDFILKSLIELLKVLKQGTNMMNMLLEGD